MVRQAPLGHDRAAPADNARDAVCSQWHVGQAYAGVNGEIIHALFALFNKRIAIDLPGELDGIAVAFLQRLIDWHGTDGHRRVAQDPLARGVDVAAGGQVHDGVCTPPGGPHHLFHLLLNGRRDGGVADVCVDLHQEVATDNHRLQLGVVDVGGDDGAAAGHLRAHELRADVLRNRGAEAFTIGQRHARPLQHGLAAHVLAMRHVNHLIGNDTSARALKLGEGLAGQAAIRGGLMRKVAREMAACDVTVVLGLYGAAFVLLDGAFLDPGVANARKAALHVDVGSCVGVGT